MNNQHFLPIKVLLTFLYSLLAESSSVLLKEASLFSLRVYARDVSLSDGASRPLESDLLPSGKHRNESSSFIIIKYCDNGIGQK